MLKFIKKDPNLFVKNFFSNIFLILLNFCRNRNFNFNPKTQFFGDKFTAHLYYAHQHPRQPFFTKILTQFHRPFGSSGDSLQVEYL
jgi:hypothetical protein